MADQRKDRRWVRWTGNVLSILGIFFVSITLYQKSSLIDFGDLGGKFLLTFLVAVLGWQLVNASIGTGWLFSLKMLNCNIGFSSSLLITFKTQIAKYIPGNIFHLVGRAVLLKQNKNSSSISFVSLLIESLILVVQGLVIWIFYTYLHLPFYIALLLPPIVAIAVLCLGGIISIRFRMLSYVFTFETSTLFKLSASCLFYYLIFFIQTTLYLVLLSSVGTGVNIGFGEAFNILTISWVGGYLIIGSPGGMGVREGIFGLLVSEMSSGPTLLFALVLLRIVSVIGDALSFLVTFWWKPNQDKEIDLV